MSRAIKARAREILARTTERRIAPLMDELGRILVEQSDTAFLNQRFGPRLVWPPKYQNQSGSSFISLAGALDDFNSGRTTPSPSSLRRRPALVGTGKLKASVKASHTRRTEVTYGSNDPRANQHQGGDRVEQPVTQRAKRNIKKYLATPVGQQFRSKLSFLTDDNRTILQTELNARPFVGITRETGARLIHRVEEFFNAP